MIRILKLSSLLLMTLFVILFVKLEAHAESLYRTTSAYGDHRARQVGDILTIVISENATATQNATSQRDKTISIGGSSNANLDATSAAGEDGRLTSGEATASVGGKFANFLNSLVRMIPLFGASISGASKYDGSQESTRRGVLNARITVVVDDVLENGNLVLKGTKQVTINSELQEIEISGQCRPEDVTTTNTINSNLIANASIRYNGEMAYSENAGFFSNVWNKLAEILF